jgi:hypothetical protein
LNPIKTYHEILLLIFIAWKKQNDKAALVKDTIECFGWNYDPDNPLNKEEQKKAWLSQSQKNVKAKTAIEGMGWEYVSKDMKNTS